MARMAELKAAREREEQRERERLKREEEEERLRNMTSASKALNKWVGKIRPGNVPVQQEHQDQHDDLTPHHSNIDQTSAQQQQHHHREDLHSSGDGILTQLIPMRNHLQDSRRTSMDSGIVSGASRSTDDVNLAPRLSVGDLTSYFSNCDNETQPPDDAKSVLSMLSDPSGMFVDSDENAVLEVSGGKLPSYSTTNGGTDEEDKEEDEPQLSSELLELSINLGGDPLRRKEKPKSEPIRRGRTRTRGEGGNDMIATGNPCEAFCGDGVNAFNRSRTPHSSEHQCDLDSDDLLETHVITLCTERDAYEARNNTMSVASDDMSDCSRESSSGLIVGFSNRRTSIGDSGDDLIVGFVNRRESTRKA
ncbi:hypothetical protein ACHAW5_007365 [Stephanodiscus triporus]|uniref:Uncharacterized protein n=1 Tax=Stephanodiscus triporus TaxID=2934178 RepID=A0ABD3P815_9STRA